MKKKPHFERVESINSIKIVFVRFGAFFLIFASILFSLSISLVVYTEVELVRKADLHERLITAINNGAELDDVRHLLHIREESPESIFSDSLNDFEYLNKKDDFYLRPVNLHQVLKDIKARIFLKNPVDMELVKRVKGMIANHEETNPFDRLKSNQRIHFEVIQSKLGDDYINIHDDVIRVIDELENRNSLVDEYFSDATMSYRISILAFIVSIVSLLIPLIKPLRSWRRKKRNRKRVERSNNVEKSNQS